MLTVVFGAGASYDSAPSHPASSEPGLADRPPLADQLFQERDLFARALARFPECHAVVPDLRNLGQNGSVEKVLERLQLEAVGGYPKGLDQFAAVRYYLQYMLTQCTARWENVHGGITNYKTLLDHINRRRKPGEQVCLVTFNRDTMLELALRTLGMNPGSIGDYVANATDYKLIKLHGSTNWGREVEDPPIKLGGMDQWQAVEMLIADAARIRLGRYHVVDQNPVWRHPIAPPAHSFLQSPFRSRQRRVTSAPTITLRCSRSAFKRRGSCSSSAGAPETPRLSRCSALLFHGPREVSLWQEATQARGGRGATERRSRPIRPRALESRFHGPNSQP